MKEFNNSIPRKTIQSLLSVIRKTHTSNKQLFPCAEFSHLSIPQKPLEGLLKHQQLRPTPSVSDSGGLRCGLKISQCNRFTGKGTLLGGGLLGTTIIVGRHIQGTSLRGRKAAYFAFMCSLMGSTK